MLLLKMFEKVTRHRPASLEYLATRMPGGRLQGVSAGMRYTF